MGGCLFIVINEQVVFVDDYYIFIFDVYYFLVVGRWEQFYVVQVDDMFFFVQCIEDRVCLKDILGQEIFVEVCFFSCFGDDDMVVDCDCDVLGEDEVWDRIKENYIFLLQVVCDQCFCQCFVVQFQEYIFVRVWQFFVVDNFFDYFFFVGF